VTITEDPTPDGALPSDAVPASEEALTLVRQQLEALAGKDGEEVPLEVIELVEHARRLDAILSAGGQLPTAWQGARPFGMPEDCDVVGHTSKVHPGLNVEIDAPEGTLVTVHLNDWQVVNQVIPA
jgi:hypothetical protein